MDKTWRYERQDKWFDSTTGYQYGFYFRDIFSLISFFAHVLLSGLNTSRLIKFKFLKGKELLK